MAKAVELDPAARDEVAAAAEYLEAQRAGLGIELIASLRITLARLADAPESCAAVPGAPGVRTLRVKRFSYRVFFVEQPERLRVIAVAHARRRGGYWRDRL